MRCNREKGQALQSLYYKARENYLVVDTVMNAAVERFRAFSDWR